MEAWLVNNWILVSCMYSLPTETLGEQSLFLFLCSNLSKTPNGDIPIPPSTNHWSISGGVLQNSHTIPLLKAEFLYGVATSTFSGSNFTRNWIASWAHLDFQMCSIAREFYIILINFDVKTTNLGLYNAVVWTNFTLWEGPLWS